MSQNNNKLLRFEEIPQKFGKCASEETVLQPGGEDIDQLIEPDSVETPAKLKDVNNNSHTVAKFLPSISPTSSPNTSAIAEILGSKPSCSLDADGRPQEAEIARLVSINRELSTQYGTLQEQFSELLSEHNRLQFRQNMLELGAMQNSKVSPTCTCIHAF